MWVAGRAAAAANLSNHEFRSRWAHEALTRENMSSWAHARTPTPKHSCSSEQIKQGHVPTSCGTPVAAPLGLTATLARLRGVPGTVNTIDRTRLLHCSVGHQLAFIHHGDHME